MIGWIYFLILVELFAVSWIDLKIKKISNLWFFLNLSLGIGLHFLQPELYVWEWATLLFPLGFIVGGFALFILGIMGAGDSKFLASLFLVIPLEHHALMFERLIYTTVLVGCVLLTVKIGRDFKIIKAYALSAYWSGLKASIKSSFSFAPVVFIAWILVGVELWM
jgi:prepilin peptidase CpaA